MGETRFFVGNVPTSASEQDLQAEFGHYGVVNSVEIKTKNQNEKFAFVNLQIEDRLVEKCIREFGQQQFKGNYLSVSRAKESFLERLKREREEALRPQVPAPSAFRHEEDHYYESYAPLPKIEKEVSSDESSSEEEEIVQAPVKKVAAWPDTTPNMTKAMIDDMKRQESLLKLKSRHDEQRLAIKNALLGIDTGTRNNKIVFEPPEPKPEIEQEPELPKSNKKRKAQLFDEEDESEKPQESFKVKKQFAGKNGEKLFELQNRFQNDKRFEIDEKFADDPEDTFDDRKKYTRDQLKERKKLRKEMENWDQNEMKDERDNQLSILEGITGESTGLLNHHGQAKQPQKGMLRFDPSKKDHLKYLDLVKGDIAAEDERDNAGTSKNQGFEVSEEKFYEVSENLAQSLQQKTESKPFSIFEMLGVHHEDEPEEEKQESKPEEIKVLTKLPAFHINQVKFKYDSSDTDEEAEKTKERSKKKVLQKQPKGGKYSKSGVWRHNFFVADGDKRLKEAFAYIKKSETISSEAFDEKRKKLKQVIKSKIRKARSDQRKYEKPSKKRKV